MRHHAKYLNANVEVTKGTECSSISIYDLTAASELNSEALQSIRRGRIMLDDEVVEKKGAGSDGTGAGGEPLHDHFGTI